MMRMIAAGLLSTVLAGTAGAQTFTVTGRFEYEDKGWSYSGWSGADGARPIRRADVTVLDDTAVVVLGSGTTDENGEFSIEASSVGVTQVRVRVDADTNLDPVFQRVRVTTTGGTEYTAFSPAFPAHDTALDLDVGTTTVLKTLSGGAEGNPFNILDMGVTGFDYILGPLVAETTVGTIRMNWPGTGGSFASGSSLTLDQDDGYDDAVNLHELGHVVQNLYSESDNPGGTHVFGDSDQDPRLSFGEGYATFFGACVMVTELNKAGLYFDGSGSSQSGGVQLRLRLEETTPYSGDAFGAADEVAVACTLFDILDDETSPDQAGGVDDDDFVSGTLINGIGRHRAWWDTLEGPVAAAANLSINDAWDGWFALHGAGGLHAGMQALFSDHRMHFFEDVDEPNDTIDTPHPTSIGPSWSSEHTLYTSNASPPVPGSGDFDWWSASIVKGSRIAIETRYPAGAADADTQCDTYLDLWDALGTKHAEAESGGTGRNARIAGFVVPSTGTWKWRVRTQSNFRRYGRYDVRATYEFENHLPTILSGPVAAPSTLTDVQTSALSVSASDVDAGQTLSYSWTPLNGGSILGSGAAVTFVPPDVATSTLCEVALVVSDNLGATTTAAVLPITVEPGGSPCGAPASVSVGGVGKAGLAGVPVLTPLGLPVVPGTDFKLRLSQALPFGQAWIFAGFSLISAPFDGGTLYPALNKTFLAGVPGSGTVDLPIPFTDPIFCGLAFYVQVLVPNDPGAAGSYQTSQTNYVAIVPGA